MPTVYLHIGRAKTGTTAIQNYMSAHRATLLARDVHYVYADDCGAGHGHQTFAKSFIKELPSYMVPPHDPDTIRQQVGSEIREATAQTIVLSSENFTLAHIPDVHAFFDRHPVSFDIKIILFARSQDELVESQYNQMVKLKRERRPFLEYVETEIETYDFMHWARQWSRHFGDENIICRLFDNSSGDSITQFLSCFSDVDPTLDSAFSDPASERPRNPSVGFKALSVARLLNTVEMNDRELVYQAIFERFANHDLPALFFNSDTAREFRSRFAESNLAFTERYFDRAQSDLGGRRYTDDERDQIREEIDSILLLSI